MGGLRVEGVFLGAVEVRTGVLWADFLAVGFLRDGERVVGLLVGGMGLDRGLDMLVVIFGGLKGRVWAEDVWMVRPYQLPYL